MTNTKEAISSFISLIIQFHLKRNTSLAKQNQMTTRFSTRGHQTFWVSKSLFSLPSIILIASDLLWLYLYISLDIPLFPFDPF